MPPKQGAPPRPGPTTDRGNPAADLLQIASSLIIDTTADCNLLRPARSPRPASGASGAREHGKRGSQKCGRTVGYFVRLSSSTAAPCLFLPPISPASNH